jgi:hypothetical protein
MGRHELESLRPFHQWSLREAGLPIERETRIAEFAYLAAEPRES